MIDWKKETLALWDDLNRMAVVRFGEGTLAEEAALSVIDALEADSWSRLRRYKGKASVATFIRSLSARLLEDFSRSRFGRVRPPLWVKTFGGIWEKLFTALCLQRLQVGDAVEAVYQRQIGGNKSEIEAAAFQLLARIPDCGTLQPFEVPYEEENRPQGVGQHEPRSVEDKQVRELFHCIYQVVLGKSEYSLSEGLLEKFKKLDVSLHAEEKLLLKLCYQEGLKVSEAGRMLGLTRFQAHGKMRRLMSRLRAEFERIGMDRELRSLLQE